MLTDDEYFNDPRVDALARELTRTQEAYNRLRQENRSPGIMHEVDRAFYDLAVKERDWERARTNRLTTELAAANAKLAEREAVILAALHEIEADGSPATVRAILRAALAGESE